MQRKLSKLLAVSVFAGTVALAAAVPAEAQTAQTGEPISMPKVGDLAPDFTLNYFDGRT